MFKDRDVCACLVAASVTACVGLTAALPAPASAAQTRSAAAAKQIFPGHAVSSSTFTSLYAFSGPDGASPQGALEYLGTRKSTTLIGAAQAGGADNDGTLFSYTTAPAGLGTFFTFSGLNGATPSGGLADAFGDFAVPGALYGVTSSGGANGFGAIYVAGISGAQEVLYSFTGGADGANPVGRLVKFGRTYYGTTSAGAAGFGTVFAYTPGGTLTTLHTFTGLADGGVPLAGLALSAAIPAGNAAARLAAVTGIEEDANKVNPAYLVPALYGTTSQNGNADGSGDGTIFSITANGKFTTLHTFTDTTAAPGAGPQAELVSDLCGDLYGTTFTGGSAGVGEIFKLARNGSVTVVHDFPVDPTSGITTTGANPDAPLTVTIFGQIFGTTSSGGVNGLGNVFELLPSGQFAVLHEFAGPDGAQPQGKLVTALDGSIYGTTYYGGANGVGTIFSLSR